jgi:hypothetical protein
MRLERDLFCARLTALFSGAPSTLYAVVSNTDPLEATRAAGAMLVPRNAGHSIDAARLCSRRSAR